MADAYDYRHVEHKWQSRWDREQLYRPRADDAQPKYYTMEMLPYPSGDLHIGHAKNYTFGDAVARMMRMLGYNVLHPMGWDAFGLPAENAAIARGVDPAAWTAENILNMRRQIRLMGTGYDWSREIATCEPEYYRWNQWLFLRLREHGLAYKREAPVNWCPVDATVLANEQVIDGRCWRCSSLVERRNLSQWFLKITAYADRLLEDLERLDGWPERTKTMQRNWIGRSEGARVRFQVEGLDESVEVFTTRLDTLYGATFLAVAPEHPIVRALAALVTAEYAVQTRDFATSLQSKTELERTSMMEKRGVFSGAYAINPLSRERLPIWVTNYVLAEYGSGAVMGVPAHDERDFDFAKRYGLAIEQVIVADDGRADSPLQAPYLDDGRLIASGEFTGTSSADARAAMAARLTALGAGEATIGYKLRDWLISRQRYWGTPIPIVYCARCGEVAVPDEQLPVLLPPRGGYEEFLTTACPRCGEPARRESDTMDTFFESSWYYLRYLDPHNDAAPWSSEAARRWMNVDQYIGGAEHAVLHLLYSRFFYKFFHDRGWIAGSDEPFQRLFHQGLVLRDGDKMSKSRGNVVGIDETADRHGIDAMRLFLLYVTPPEETSNWTDEGISGRVRLLNRMWRACQSFSEGASEGIPHADTPEEKSLLRAVHVAAKSAVDETLSRRFHYNATIAKFDELVNLMTAVAGKSPNSAALRYGVEMLPILIAPFAPHIAEELWERLGHTGSVHLERYLVPDERLLLSDEVTLVVQVNGKVRARILAGAGVNEEEAVALALRDPNVRAYLDGKDVRKAIFVPGRLLNLVAA
ncbi:MAG: leucine--tRNA ligase [Candidatus Eremiobacteraeota bacterium]|nr:leucine--tRNA ligase [Candidatus Eremiobacteraeota bacterium]MBV9263326.1 leucine--tRNA ligase [Candidatus Eremiobacteraeota bacterium]